MINAVRKECICSLPQVPLRHDEAPGHRNMENKEPRIPLREIVADIV